MNINEVIGRWYILAWRQDYDDGRVTYPLGERLRGFVQYENDGNMQLLITAEDRKNFSGGQWTASDAEKAHAYSSCLSYAGSYEILGDEMHHRVAVSLFPNWVGGVQRRKATLSEGQLRLIARLDGGTPRSAHSDADLAAGESRRAVAMKSVLTLALGGLCSLAAFDSSAHHSFAMFDNQKELTLEGVVKEFQWTNPHVWVQLLVVDAAGHEATWSIEGSSLNNLERRGWTKSSVKPGDRATVIIHPLKQEGIGGSLIRMSVNGMPVGDPPPGS